MKRLSFFVVGAIICAAAIAFWRTRGRTVPESGVLTRGVEALAAAWEAKKIPAGQRAVTFLLIDPQAASDPFLLAPPAAGKEAKPSVSALDQAFSSSPGVVSWALRGAAAAGAEGASRELEKAILTAHDAGAEIDIVAQGEEAAPVLLALKRLEGVERGGVKVGAGKVLLLGFNAKLINSIPAFASVRSGPPGNVLDLAYVWVDGKDRSRITQFHHFGHVAGGEWLMLENLWPEVAGPDAVAKTLALLRSFIEDPKALEDILRAKSPKEVEPGAGAAPLAPPEMVPARAMRAAGLAWVALPGGDFTMGLSSGTRVRIKPFEMAKTLVTNAQYGLCVRAGVCRSPENLKGDLAGDDQPVVGVSWDDAAMFAKWVGGRLPSEAEWEYAARSGGRMQMYPWGNDLADCRKAVVSEGGDGCGRAATWPVCSKPAGNTSQGLCDMSGNAWEWVQDWYHDSLAKVPGDGSAWEQPPGSQRVIRGSSWRLPGPGAMSYFRFFLYPSSRNDAVSFRPAR